MVQGHVTHYLSLRLKMMHKHPRNDTETPGANVDTKFKTLKQYVEHVERQVLEEHKKNLTDYERGYQDGWYDAHVKIKGD